MFLIAYLAFGTLTIYNCESSFSCFMLQLLVYAFYVLFSCVLLKFHLCFRISLTNKKGHNIISSFSFVHLVVTFGE